MQTVGIRGNGGIWIQDTCQVEAVSKYGRLWDDHETSRASYQPNVQHCSHGKYTSIWTVSTSGTPVCPFIQIWGDLSSMRNGSSSTDVVLCKTMVKIKSMSGGRNSHSKHRARWGRVNPRTQGRSRTQTRGRPKNAIRGRSKNANEGTTQERK